MLRRRLALVAGSPLRNRAGVDFTAVWRDFAVDPITLAPVETRRYELRDGALSRGGTDRGDQGVGLRDACRRQ